MDSVPDGRLLFVLPEGKTAADASPAMQAAFKAAAEEKMEPSWATTRVCLGRKRRDPTEVFVCDPFAGAAFEHLRQIQARVVGPLCVSMAIRTQVALPRRAEPVYSLAFRNLVLTCSALASGERERLKTLVELMGGSMVAPLTASVTHVVAGDVGSKKYHVAASKKLPVMQPSWVQFFWDTEQHNLAHANHPSYAHMRLPAFKGLVITVSQVPAAERKKLQALVESNGGSYSGQLRCKKTTHLALLDATGDKYDHACLWKLHCVHVRWLHESAEAGYALDESLYAVEPRKKSTPNRLDPNSSLPSWDCSAISSKIDLTHLSESGCTNESSLVLPDGHPRDPVDDVDVERLSTCCGQFLDGCCVLLWGFAQEKLEKMRKVVNACGGARLDEYKEGVTHVVVAESEGPSEIVKLIQRHGGTPHVLSAKWFAESCMSGKLQKIDMYLLADLHSNVDSAELPSDCLPSSTTGRRKSLGLEQSPALAPDFADIVEQYRGSVNVGTNVWDAAPTSYQERSVSTTVASGEDEASLTLGPAEASARSSALAQSTLENVEPSQALFTGMTFRIHDFKKEDELILEEAVTRNGGTIFRDSGVEKMGEQQLIDVVPLVVDSQEEYSHLSGRIVTYCWLQACIHFERLLPFEDNTLFLPFTRPPSQEPLRDCVISFSQYCSPEREFLIHLAETLGATCQEFLARSANRSNQRKLRPNTHLVAREPEGSKFKAATSWGLPVVTKDWLIASAKSGFKMDEDMFLVISPDSLSPGVSPAPNMSGGQKDARDGEALQQPDSSADGPNMSCGTPSERVSPEVRPCTEATGPAQETCSVQNTGSFTPGKKLGDVASPVWADEQSGNAVCGRLHMGATQPPSTPDGRRKVSTSSAATPGSFLQSQRLRELVSEGHHSINSSTASIDASTEDESFQQPIDGSYKPKLNITGLEESFLLAKENRDTPRRSRPLSLGEQVARNIELNIERFRAQDDLKELLASPSPGPEKAPVQCAAPRPLAGAVVCVSKKLAHVQKELGDIVGELGGQFVLAYSEQCTHMVHQGKPGEAVPREVLRAREQGKKLVSCGWVYACKGAGSWLDEADFPSALDGRLSLEGHVSAVLIPKQRSQQTSPPKPVRPPPEEPKAVERPDHQLIHAQLDEIMRFATEVERRRSLLPLPPPPTKASTPHSRPKSAPAPPVRSKLACSPNEIFASLSDSEAGSVQITWDDPTRRMEMARLADKLAKPQKSDSSPSPEEEEEENVGEQEEEEKEGVADTVEPAVESPDKVFVLSGFSDEQKNHYTSIVAKLNGRLLTSKAYNPEMTHLVLVLCMRSERYLGALAAGKFILHTAYLDECAKAGRFLDEEEFEWGGPMTAAYLKSLSTTKAQKVKGSDAYAPRRWRQRIAEQPLNAKGAFWDWRVVIYAGASRIPAYVNVLTAGGATILPSTVMSDHVGPGEVTHALFDPGAAKGMQLSPFVDADVLCLKVEYIAAVLVEDPPPPPEGYYIPEVVKLLRSRRGSEEVSSSTSPYASKRPGSNSSSRSNLSLGVKRRRH